MTNTKYCVVEVSSSKYKKKTARKIEEEKTRCKLEVSRDFKFNELLAISQSQLQERTFLE